MGQHGSCIQGNHDWSGAYEKASPDTELYEQIRKLANMSSKTKELQEFENFLKNKIHPGAHKKGSKTLFQKSAKSSPANLRTRTLPPAGNYEELFRKESSCKDINFNQNMVDTKTPSVKSILVTKSTCKVHGHSSSSQGEHYHQHRTSPPCRVHGSQSSSDGEFRAEQQKIPHSQPPTYKHPPQKTTVALNFKPDNEEFSDDDTYAASTFSCPEFLTSLILPSEEIETLDILASVGVQSAKEIIQRLEDRAESIVETFGVVLKHLEHGDWSTFCISTSRLCDDIKNVMRDYHLNVEMKDVDAVQIKNQVTDALNQLTTKILSLNQISSTEANHSALLPSFKVLGEVLHKMMEFLISKELKVLIECLNPDTKNSSIRMATCALAEMSLSGALMSKLIAQAGAVQPLLKLCKISKCRYLRPLALRVLTVICTSQKALEEFEKANGFGAIMSLLSVELEDKILCETIGLLAQILKQWSEAKVSIAQKVGQDLNQLVQNLTEAAKKSLTPEMFLLSAACLATLSACNTKATNWLKTHAEEMRLLASSNKQESYV